MRSTWSSNASSKPFRLKHYLTAEEEIEKKRIQKLKLASKDRMMELLHRHQHEAR